MYYRLTFFLLYFQLYDCTFGPPYPITGAWFKDRFTASEWNFTLREFTKLGGDTVLLRAPAIKLVQYDDLVEDNNFKWCGDNFRGNPTDEYRDCYHDAMKHLQIYNITVAAIGLYEYEEDFDESAILQCPQYDKKIKSDRLYHRLVLPMSERSDPCDLNGTDVLLLFTIFSGIDPHAELLTVASQYNMSVYFGLPQPPIWYKNGQVKSATHLIAYYNFIQRVLMDHKLRYSFTNSSKELDLYKTVKGYFWSSDLLLTDSGRSFGPRKETYIEIFKTLANYIHNNKKLFGVSTYTQANKLEESLTLDNNIDAFTSLVIQCGIDVISVKDGRGLANGALFWETQYSTRIDTADPGLYQILEYYYPSVMHNRIVKTFDYFFNFSVHEIFDALSRKRDDLQKASYKADVWLNIDTFDGLHDDPCLPVDISSSGMDQLVNSVTKSRVDRVLTHAGSAVQKVVAFAWDPSFTCTTKQHTFPIKNQIQADSSRPIISQCFFHSSANRSVVVIGYNLMQETQGFTVEWPNVNRKRITSHVYGYYFELDWGIQHDRVPSLMYIQMYDPYNVIDLAQKGYVKISADGAYHSCMFKYDFTRGKGFINYENDRQVKRFYHIEQKPVYRIYGQDIPF